MSSTLPAIHHLAQLHTSLTQTQNTSRIGLAVQIESAGSEEFMEMQERAQQQNVAPAADVPPF